MAKSDKTEVAFKDLSDMVELIWHHQDGFKEDPAIYSAFSIVSGLLCDLSLVIRTHSDPDQQISALRTTLAQAISEVDTTAVNAAQESLEEALHLQGPSPETP